MEQIGLETALANPAPKILQGADNGVCTAAARGSTLQRTRRVDASIVQSLEQPAAFGPGSRPEGAR